MPFHEVAAHAQLTPQQVTANEEKVLMTTTGCCSPGEPTEEDSSSRPVVQFHDITTLSSCHEGRQGCSGNGCRAGAETGAGPRPGQDQVGAGAEAGRTRTADEGRGLGAGPWAGLGWGHWSCRSVNGFTESAGVRQVKANVSNGEANVRNGDRHRFRQPWTVTGKQLRRPGTLSKIVR